MYKLTKVEDQSVVELFTWATCSGVPFDDKASAQ